MASELLKNRALIQRLKEPKLPTVDFSLSTASFESTLPEPKPQELLDIQENVRIQRQQDTMNKARPFLMDESVDFIERQGFAKKGIVRKPGQVGAVTPMYSNYFPDQIVGYYVDIKEPGTTKRAYQEYFGIKKYGSPQAAKAAAESTYLKVIQSPKFRELQTDRLVVKQEAIVKSFLNHLENNGEFDGYEKLAKELEEFKDPPKKNTPNNYETINKIFKQWKEGKFQVEGVNRKNLSANAKQEIKNWSPKARGERTKIRQKQFQFLDNLNNEDLPLNAVKQAFKKEFGKEKFYNEKTFGQRANQLTQLKKEGSLPSSADGSKTMNYGVEVGKRATWLKKALSESVSFGNNYNRLIRASDVLQTQGKIKEAQRLSDVAKKFFGSNGVLTKLPGQAEHPLSVTYGGTDNLLKVDSLVKGDLNQLKRVVFDNPIKKLTGEYNKSGVTIKRKNEIKNLIQNRKSFMNYLTSGSFDKGIVEKVNFNFTPDKVTATADVTPIDKLGKNYDFGKFVQKGEEYSKIFKEKGKDLDLITKGGFAKRTAISDKNILKLIQSIGCPNNKADGGRIGFQDGTSCFLKGQKAINTGNIPEGAAKRNFVKFANQAIAAGRQAGTGLKTIAKLGILPEMVFLGADTLVRTTMGDTLDEAFLRASDFYRLGDQALEADIKELERRLGPDDARAAINMRKMYAEKEKLDSIEQEEQADLALAGTDFAETNIGMSEDEIKKFYADRKQEQENRLFNASISEAEEFEGLAEQAEFEDIKGISKRESSAGQALDLMTRNIPEPVKKFFRGRTTVDEPDVSQEAILQAFKNQGGTEEEVRNLDFSLDQANKKLIEQNKRPTAAIQFLNFLKTLERQSPMPEGGVRTTPTVTDAERKLLFEAAKEEPALAERYFGFSRMPFGEFIGQTDLQDDMNLDRGIYALGGRIGFKDGPKNPGRRTFLKVMGGIASLPVVGKLFKGAKPVVEKLVNTPTKMPDWFPNFVQKFMNNSIGKKIDADLMEYKNPDLPGVTVTRSDDGRVFVEGRNEYDQPYEIQYEPPGYELVDPKTGQAVKTPGNFEAVEGRHVAVGPEDYDVEAYYPEDLDEIAAGDIRAMEKYASGKVSGTVKDAMGKDTGLKKGEYDLNMAEGRAEAEADIARDLDDYYED